MKYIIFIHTLRNGMSEEIHQELKLLKAILPFVRIAHPQSHLGEKN